jgi:cell wall-associated NlpC family hydrolase
MAIRYYFICLGLGLGILLGPESVVGASSDAAYTGTTNSSAATPPAPVKHKKKKKVKAANDTTSSTNSVANPTPPVASTNNAPAEISPPALTNSVEKIESSKPATTNTPTETEPEKPATNSIEKTNAPSSSTNAVTAPAPPSVHTTSLTPADLKEYADLSPSIQALIAHGLELTKLNLKYEYGSDDPEKGGMDCSGTVHYLLEQTGLKDVPRDATGIYTWAWKEGHIQPVASSSLKSFELDRLKPGDLLFWTGTYDVQRDPPISHVMIYLGTNRETGRRVMVGASEGRTYGGKSQYGVSVFDFVLPGSSRESSGRFIGYGPVPGL